MNKLSEDKLQIVPSKYLTLFRDKLAISIKDAFQNLPTDHELSTESFSFYTSVAAAYSSMIEGEQIEVDSYLKSQLNPGVFKKDYTKKTDDLLAVYKYAKKTELSLRSCLKTHDLLSANLLKKTARGKIRRGMEFILDQNDKIIYVAASPGIVEIEIEKLFSDIELLKNADLSVTDCFYYAAMIQLVLLKIHPFEDGNGRAARLLEKWFLAEKLGDKAWSIQSEKYYYHNLQEYYRNLHIGMDYEDLDFDKCIPLLLMLPKSIE